MQLTAPATLAAMDSNKLSGDDCLMPPCRDLLLTPACFLAISHGVPQALLLSMSVRLLQCSGLTACQSLYHACSCFWPCATERLTNAECTLPELPIEVRPARVEEAGAGYIHGYIPSDPLHCQRIGACGCRAGR